MEGNVLTDQTGFAISVAQNPYLAPEEATMHAVVTVEFEPAGEAAADVAEIIVIDRSASMTGPKFTEAKRAAKAAIDAIREDASFAIIAGGTRATELYPGDGRLATGSEVHKRSARNAVDAMKLGSATAIGAWLRRAAEIASTRPGAIGHVLLLTDGQVNQRPSDYDADLDYCRGRFTCDAIGIGTGWNAEELGRIARLFHGTREYCRDLTDLAGFFTAASERAMGKAADDVALAVKGPKGFELKGLWQAYPTERDLLPEGRAGAARRTVFDLGVWGAEQRQYLMELAFPPTGVGYGRDVRLELVRRGETVAEGSISARWTDNPAESEAFHPDVLHHRAQLAGVEHIREGLRHWRRRDPAAATRQLLTALEHADRVGNREQAESIREFLDFEGHEVTIRTDASREHELWLETRGDYTVRTPTSIEGGGS